jgi:hypothetical protein
MNEAESKVAVASSRSVPKRGYLSANLRVAFARRCQGSLTKISRSHLNEPLASSERRRTRYSRRRTSSGSSRNCAAILRGENDD